MPSTIVPDVELYFDVFMWTLFALALNWVPVGQLFSNNEYLAQFMNIVWAPWKVGDNLQVPDIVIPEVWIMPGGPLYVLLHLLWAILTSLAYFFVRRGDTWDANVASNILFYVLVCFVAIWPWLGFPFETVGLGLAALLVAIGVSVAATIVFWIQEPWYSGLLALFGTLVLCVIFAQMVVLRRVWLRKFITTSTSAFRQAFGATKQPKARSDQAMRTNGRSASSLVR